MSSYYKTSSERQKSRFWQRFLTGAELADRLRFMTLNSSDESVVLGLNIIDSFSKLVMRIRRRWGAFEYFGVVECDKDVVERKHLHLICKGVFLPQRELEDMWVATHRSIKPYIKGVDNTGSAARYLGKYIGKEGYGRYLMSGGWIFEGYVGWSKGFKRRYGYYPDSELLRYLANLPVDERKYFTKGVRYYEVEDRVSSEQLLV